MVNFIFDILTSPFRRTSAVKTIPGTGASTTVSAGIAGTIIDGTIGWIAHKARIADALGSVGVFHANTIGWTGRILAKTFQFAMAACESWETLTVISANVIDTLATVGAGSG